MKLKQVATTLVLGFAFLSMTACRSGTIEPSSTAPTDDVATMDTATLEESPNAAESRTDGPAPLKSVEAGDLVGRFGLSDDALDLKAADSDATKVFGLKANGRYIFTGGVVRSREEGRWSLEENGTRLRLTPDHVIPESGVLLFAVESPDKLLLLNPDGSPTNWPAGLVRIEH